MSKQIFTIEDKKLKTNYKGTPHKRKEDVFSYPSH